MTMCTHSFEFSTTQMLNVLRRLRSSFLILLLAELICNPFRICHTLGDGTTGPLLSQALHTLDAVFSEVFRLSPWLSTFLLLINLHKS